MSFAVRVVHLGDHASQAAVGAEAPEHGQRVEHVAEDPRVGEHDDPAARAEVDAALGEEPFDVAS